MKYRDYKELYIRLRTPQDIDVLSKEIGYSKELLLVIYTQRVVRQATKRFYKVKRHAGKMLWQWKKGRSFVEIARKYDFPPVLTALLILDQNKISRRQYWKYLLDPRKVKDNRLRSELKEVAKEDIVYSPEGASKQYERGRWGERKLKEWLDEHAIPYRTENELRAIYDKTPDTLLKKPLEWNSSKKYWIESKATFGDPLEIKRHLRRQLKPYAEMFGDGLVVYWFGYVEDVEINLPEGISITDGQFFEK